MRKKSSSLGTYSVTNSTKNKAKYFYQLHLYKVKTLAYRVLFAHAVIK